MRKKRIEPGVWHWPGRPRVLIEDPDLESSLASAWALRRAGYTVAICRGPEPDEYCPLVGPHDCALVTGADVVIAGLGPEIDAAVRERHPDKPVVQPAPPDQLVSAVRDALASKAAAG
jgi:hypothetical protein